MKKGLSLLLIVMLLTGLMAFPAMADTTEEGFELPIVSEPVTLTLWLPAGDVVFKTVSNQGESAPASTLRLFIPPSGTRCRS